MGEKETILLIIASLTAIILLCASFIFILFIYRNRKIKHITETNNLIQQHKNELLQSQLEIQQNTMLHIGQELHDSVGQKLTLASLYTQQIDYNNNHPELKEKIFDVSNIINESLDELRSISKNLTASNFSNTSFYNLIVAECNRIKKLGKCVIHFTQLNVEHLVINNHSKTLLVRIVQECLTNCLKHSHCSNINIDIRIANDLLSIVIKDDGIGFNTNATSNNVGLQSMHNRIKILDGKIDMQSAPNKGTKTLILVNEKKLM